MSEKQPIAALLAETTIIILAAGKGKRMLSDKPKAHNIIGNKTLLDHVLDTSFRLKAKHVIVVVPLNSTEIFKKACKVQHPTWVEQEQPLGTAHAVASTLGEVKTSHCLILNADTPLIKEDILLKLIHNTQKSLGIITAIHPNPHGYGRIIRDKNLEISEIVEERDCNDILKEITEINAGIGYFPKDFLQEHWHKIQNNNQQKEYYLTDYVKLWNQQHRVASYTTHNIEHITGINNKLDLIRLERLWQKRHAEELIKKGVHIHDPCRFDCQGDLHAQSGVTIDINVIIRGKVTIGKNSHIGAHCILENVAIGNNTTIQPYSYIRNTTIGSAAHFGPFSYARNKTTIGNHTKIGCFVETKETHLDDYTKASHLTYLGNLNVGKHVNIGAGFIHCNYNGVNKYSSTIDDHAFIGANTQIVGPCHIGAFATIAAGSTITKNAPAEQLTIARSKQVSLSNWQRPEKKDILNCIK